MTDILVWGGMLIAFLGVIWGKIVVAAAREFVKSEHPAAFRAMSGFGTPILKNFSTDDRRVERALASKMLFGRLPDGPQIDPRMARIRNSWRLAAAMIAGGLALTVFTMRAAIGG
jgi:hypothetical protein